MKIENDQAYADVLRQLSTSELLTRYYQQVLRTSKRPDAAQLKEGTVTINDVQMSVGDARDYLIMQLVKQSH